MIDLWRSDVQPSRPTVGAEGADLEVPVAEIAVTPYSRAIWYGGRRPTASSTRKAFESLAPESSISLCDCGSCLGQLTSPAKSTIKLRLGALTVRATVGAVAALGLDLQVVVLIGGCRVVRDADELARCHSRADL